ncbi:BTB/POZ and CAP-Gly domain-containing protein [Phanerochaete sordida]|uniref:BTB/POZ and CAP-Gly domain-containing protein n=1 Tax=Phanerochaete sordida TaxID=48140 RepID=A0A9P3L9G2_9APHY|nr:BTB/POZ and CAP-Gly domain-containing protein [Phanerochaete sordida]
MAAPPAAHAANTGAPAGNSATNSTPPALQEATARSTVLWQDDLQALFEQAKERFPDVVWELSDEDDPKGTRMEEVWGHKAIVYARAPPSFQSRYFQSRPPPPSQSPYPYSTSPTSLPAQSALSLALAHDFGAASRSPSPFRAASPSPSQTVGGVLRLNAHINPTLFSNELEYLYTGKGLGEAFEFLFDSGESTEEGDGEDGRIDKLRKDLVFMWRSRLYSDVRIALTGNISSSSHENTTAIFSSHRFILVSRSPYFHTQLLQWGVKQTSGEPLTVTLPSPPFTPASLHFTLGYIYTGTLVFSHRTFDLDTSFHIMRSATYLGLDSLYDEIQARIVQEMMHGLFHAFLEFSEYESITGGKWGTGGCRCRQCARRAPRVLEFSLLDDVKNPHLERGARRALVGLFGEGWCNAEFARLTQKMRDTLLKGLAKRSTPLNVFPLLYAAQTGMKKLEGTTEPWAEISRDMILAARKTIDDVLCSQAAECFEQDEWLEIMEADGAHFDDGERVELIMEAVRRGMNEKNAAVLYQTLVSSILLRPHATEADQAMLSATSHVRVQVEQTRMDILRWMRRRWVGVKQEGGFDKLDDWALVEIAHEIDVKQEELLNPNGAPATPTGKPRGGPKARAEEDTHSVYSLRTPHANRNVTRLTGEGVRSSAASVRSVARSTHSTVSRTSTATRRTINVTGPRPDSKLTPSASSSVASSIRPPRDSASIASSTTRQSLAPRRHTSTTASTNDVPSRLRSSVASTKSTASRASTVRKTVASSSGLRPPSGLSRPNSTMSTTSDGSTNFETAKSDVTPSTAARSRVVSAVSTTSARTAASSSPRVRVSSAASRISTATTSTNANGKRAPPSPADSKRLSPVTPKRSLSTSSARSSVVSTASTATATSRTASRKSTATIPPPVPPKGNRSSGVTDPKATIKARPKSSLHSKQPSTASARTVKGSLKRKNSSDTITDRSAVELPPSDPNALPRGATLDIGIPCIISSNRARFRAYARYIGELEGEVGPWVGVEVPVGEDWPEDRLEGRQWNDGTWGGIRYFDIGATGEWDYGDIRRRRVDWSGNMAGHGSSLKREGDQLSIDRSKRLRSVSPAVSDISNTESRGLFVRPQQVLYVVDAVA